MSWFSFLLAGFQMATYGRFWVATEGMIEELCRASVLADQKRLIEEVQGPNFATKCDCGNAGI